MRRIVTVEDLRARLDLELDALRESDDVPPVDAASGCEARYAGSGTVTRSGRQSSSPAGFIRTGG